MARGWRQRARQWRRHGERKACLRWSLRQRIIAVLRHRAQALAEN